MPKKPNVELTIVGQLLEAIRKVDRPGAVCTSGDLPLVMPGLEVEGLGPVGLPLGKTQARKLAKLCHQAPYGKGTETVVDTAVRCTWELDPDQFQLTNPKWDELVATIVEDVQQDLGLETRKLTAHLYKLLLYEKGGFFLPHRDGEKLDRMVATLVIGLPSIYEGGELIVSHEGSHREIAYTGAASGYELSYAAFYADCEHEVRPVRSGNRLGLVYNLTLAKSRSKKGIDAPTSGAAVAAIAKILRDGHKDESREKLAITLDHRYTEDGLTLDMLKGVDRVRAEVLFEAAEQAGWVAHLALVTLWQSGSAEGGDYEYSRYRTRRGWYEEEDEDEEDASDYEMGEVFDESLTVKHWSDRRGNKVGLGEIPLDEDEIVSEQPLAEWDPSREEFEGYTGNAGMTLERWYHRAAVVIWPREWHFDVLCGAGTDAAIGGLHAMVKELKRAPKARRDEQRQTCADFAAAIIDSWQPSRHRYAWDGAPTETGRSIFPLLLQELDDPSMVRRFLAHVMPGDGGVQLDKSFPAFCRRHGWPSFEAELTAVIGAASAATIARNVALLQTVCMNRDKNAERIGLCRRLADRAVASLVAFDGQAAKYDWQVAQLDRSALLASLVRSMVAVAADQPLTRLIEHVLSRDDKYDLTDAHLAAIFALESWLAGEPAEPHRAISQWLAECRSALESRVAQVPQKPADYRRPAELSCSCSDCRELTSFLANPDEAVHRFPVRKDRRQHLHQIIERHKCDLTHITERRGSPYTLVCTKTTASYEAARQIHERDKENLTRLKTVEKKIG
jgi:predicted 2-oxoglutarate/Fe(II)-dependent dioxygenase YbiX